MVRMVRMVGMRVSLGTVVMVGMVDDGRRVGVARKVAIYIVPYRPDPNRPDPTNVDSDPMTLIQPTPHVGLCQLHLGPCLADGLTRRSMLDHFGRNTLHFRGFTTVQPLSWMVHTPLISGDIMAIIISYSSTSIIILLV